VWVLVVAAQADDRDSGRAGTTAGWIVADPSVTILLMHARRAGRVRRHCPASSRWQVLGFGKVGDLRVGVAEVDLDGAVPSDRLVGSDGVVLDPVVLGVGCQVQGVWDLFEEQPLVLQGPEAAFVRRYRSVTAA